MLVVSTKILIFTNYIPKERIIMKENESALHSQFIIDGVRCPATPAELLEECMCMEELHSAPAGNFDDIIDEITEPPLSSFIYRKTKYKEYAQQVVQASKDTREFRMLYPDHFTRLQVAKSLLSRLWSEGHFKLGDLRLWAQWEWNTRPIGNMAAFYESVRNASEYIYSLGVSIEDYVFLESDGTSNVRFFAWLPETPMTEEDMEEDIEEEQENLLFKSSPYESTHPWISESRKFPSTMVADPKSWIIYIPFDTCGYRMGGSMLAQLNDDNGGSAPSIQDPDYFIDCYEVVRELVEDGIIMSARNVADGGLAGAMSRMCGEKGIKLDLSGIAASYQEEDRIRILFGEVPGVLIQVSDDNYDYVDSQFLLQDIAYYPIGHPSEKLSGINLSEAGRSGVADILASLLEQASEGED